jgi:hypothetical protein
MCSGMNKCGKPLQLSAHGHTLLSMEVSQKKCPSRILHTRGGHFLLSGIVFFAASGKRLACHVGLGGRLVN